jgi:hypothetical protein
MNHWYYILVAYAVTAVVVIVEIVAVRHRMRAARLLASAPSEPAGRAGRPTVRILDSEP